MLKSNGDLTDVGAGLALLVLVVLCVILGGVFA
jgi:hypothetical protein